MLQLLLIRYVRPSYLNPTSTSYLRKYLLCKFMSKNMKTFVPTLQCAFIAKEKFQVYSAINRLNSADTFWYSTFDY